MVRPSALFLFVFVILSPPAPAEDIPRVARGRAGQPAAKVKLKHLHVREGVRLLYGAAMLSSRYPYLRAVLPNTERPVELTPESAKRILAPFQGEAAAKEFVRLFHAGKVVESREVYVAAMRAAKVHGYSAARGDAPQQFGFGAKRQENGSLSVHLILMERSTQSLGVRSYTYTFTDGAFQKMERRSWLEGPAQHWQTGMQVDLEAEANRYARLEAFRKAVEGAVGGKDATVPEDGK